jgi:hypothetical protein
LLLLLLLLLCPAAAAAESAPVYFLDEASQRAVYADVADSWELLSFDIVNNVSPTWQEFQQGRASNEQQAAVSM